MSRQRLLVAVGLVAVLLLLNVWQRHRERLMLACHDRGGVWNGLRSSCEPAPLGIILKRAIDRS